MSIWLTNTKQRGVHTHAKFKLEAGSTKCLNFLYFNIKDNWRTHLQLSYIVNHIEQTHTIISTTHKRAHRTMSYRLLNYYIKSEA